MKEIPLTQGMTAIVDDEDYETLMQWKWRYYNLPTGKMGYAIRGMRKGRKTATILMHRIILNTPHGYVTDHINGNSLDNQKENLRVATKAQNHYNASKHRHNTSGFKGVYWCKDRHSWRAQITANRKQIQLGRFKNKFEAVITYNAAATKLHGEFARLNQVGKYKL